MATGDEAVVRGDGEVGEPYVPADELLGPLVDSATELVVGLDAEALPKSLRTLAGFDRRGLSRAAARAQILRGVLDDEGFRGQVIERFLTRPEVSAVLADWDPADVAAGVEAAAARGDLALVASVLYASRPDRWEYGLGFIAAVALHRNADRQAEAELRTREASIAALETARTRAEDMTARLRHEIEALGEDLRAERGARRSREERATLEVEAAVAARDEALAAAEAARVAVADAETTRDRLAQRLAKIETEVRDLRTAKAAPQAAPRMRREDAEALVEAAALARRLAKGLDGVAQRAKREAPRGESTVSREPARSRERVPVPGGLVLESREGLDAVLRSPGVVLVVDGYNVSMHAWGDVPIADQRDRLVAALSGLQARTKGSVTVVFDGADVVRPPERRPGVRVVFSPDGVEADTVVIEEVRSLAPEIPVVVVSSDRAVAERARSAGAGAVGSPTLVALLTA